MKLTSRSNLGEVAAAVAKALSAAGIRGVLTGGACASIYTRGTYQSSDLDFILQNQVLRSTLDAAMATVGFARHGNHYVHPTARFYVEFPAGPLAIGGDLEVRPIEHRLQRGTVIALSPTDSCRDRLAAFYFWTDRQSLKTAVQVAVRHSVNLGMIQRWSDAEGFSSAYEEFASEVRRARRRQRRRRA